MAQTSGTSASLAQGLRSPGFDRDPGKRGVFRGAYTGISTYRPYNGRMSTEYEEKGGEGEGRRKEGRKGRGNRKGFESFSGSQSLTQ